MTKPFIPAFPDAISAREPLFIEPHNTAFRLFNGFTEGAPQLSIDIFGRTAVINDYQDFPGDRKTPLPGNTVSQISGILQSKFPAIHSIVHKYRKGRTAEDRNGTLILGTRTDSRIVENGVQYALDVTINRDSGFYVDTRNLRSWAKENLSNQSVLNTFAYTGSLGVAAMAASAEVVQTDLNRRFLNTAKQSYAMNGFPVVRKNFITGDFFSVMKQFYRQGRQFDCVFLDPPYFSHTRGGTVNLEHNMLRLINKVRPLVTNGGKIVAVNNALFLSGQKYMSSLNKLCAEGYVSLGQRIDIPNDCTGYPETIQQNAFVDPAPFNHGTKIAVLNVHHNA